MNEEDEKYKTGDLLTMTWDNRYPGGRAAHIGLCIYGEHRDGRNIGISYNHDNAIYEQTPEEITIVTCIRTDETRAYEYEQGLVRVLAPNGKIGYIEEEFLLHMDRNNDKS